MSVPLTRLAREGEDGRPWYTRQRSILRAYAESHAVDYGLLCDVTAVLSPRTTVRGNGRLAALYLQGAPPNKLPCIPNARAALTHYLDTGKIRGPKTSAFARALRGDDDAIVLDVWMARAMGIEQSTLSGKQYHREAKRIQRAARRLGWPPVESQAAIWLATRRRHGMHGASTYVTFPPIQQELPL
jgi:hypothetical protein